MSRRTSRPDWPYRLLVHLRGGNDVTSGARSTPLLGHGKTRSSFPVSSDGRWHGPVLRVASTGDAFTQVVTPRAAIRTVTSTSDNGLAVARPQSGSVSQREAACCRLAR